MSNSQPQTQTSFKSGIRVCSKTKSIVRAASPSSYLLENGKQSSNFEVPSTNSH